MNTEEIITKLCSVNDDVARFRHCAQYMVYSAGLIAGEDNSDPLMDDLRYGMTNLWDLLESQIGKVQESLSGVIQMFMDGQRV